MNTRAIRWPLVNTLGVALALASGQVTGISRTAEGGFRGFFWDGAMQDLGPLEGGYL